MDIPRDCNMEARALRLAQQLELGFVSCLEAEQLLAAEREGRSHGIGSAFSVPGPN